MKRWAWVIFMVILLLAGVIVVRVQAPRMIVQHIREGIVANCPSCTLEVGDVSYSFAKPKRITFDKIRLKSGQPGGLEVDARVERVTIEIKSLNVAAETVTFQNIVATHPEVIVVDGDEAAPPALPPPANPPASSDRSFDYKISQIEFSDGTFTYIRPTHGTRASLNIYKIGGRVGEMGNANDIRDHVVEGEAHAQLEQSGHFDLKVSTFIFKRPTYVDVKVEIADQNVGDVTPFFRENDGVTLQGLLKEGSGQVELRGSLAHAQVRAVFENLKVKVERTYDRSAGMALLTNIGESLTVRGDNLKVEPENQVRSVDIERRPDESLVSFILRGMKLAAIKVATVPYTIHSQRERR